MERSLVIIPTYNEIENISKITDTVLAKEDGFDVLVIDDGSPDGTADAVRLKQQDENCRDRLFMIERSEKSGLGTAYVAGFKWALERDYSYIFEMDADFSHNPDDLPRLLNACRSGGADLAIGSRYIDGVNVVNWPMKRILMSYCASIYVRLVLGFKIYDSTAGFVCYSRKVLEGIDLDAIRMKGYGFQIEMKYTAAKNGFKIAEVPVVFVNRKEGTSKMSGGIFSEALLGVFALRFRTIKHHKNR